MKKNLDGSAPLPICSLTIAYTLTHAVRHLTIAGLMTFGEGELFYCCSRPSGQQKTNLLP